ncbi:MAG TPA: hypothetical protein VFH83_00565 [Spirochaetia bacterium]|nr:hypothetical protein [Spirochaetia bacterium]
MAAGAPDSLDPDLAALLDLDSGGEKTPSEPEPSLDLKGGEPDFHTLFGEEKPPARGKPDEVEVTRNHFPAITKIEGDPKPFFQDKDYYRKALSGEGDTGPRVHELLGKYMKAEDPEEKSHLRAQLISAFWDLGSSVANKSGHEMPIPKRLLLRFGILSPGFLTPELQQMVSRIIFDNDTGEPVFYLDEWLDRIAKGQIRPSAADEVKAKTRDAGVKVKEVLEKKRGLRDSEITLYKAKVSQLEEREAQLRAQVELLAHHESLDGYTNLKAPYTPAQKGTLASIQELAKQLSTLDGQMASSFAELQAFDKDLENLSRKSDAAADGGVDLKAASNEYACIRQMAKMCVGRKGNHFPIFHSQFVRPNIREIATRENVIKEMSAVEALDPGLFQRTHKNQTTRIVPNIILIPSYGDTGVCWEPFERFNRATSRGRVAIPLFPKSLPVAVLTALADLRWQVAKEKAQYYWMEEGITGKYYQWFSERKLRGDVREYFIRDYLLWINKESQGMQKLDKDVRGIFWRMLPFPQPIKDALRNRGFVYNELYKKDQNIAKSDGY